MKIRGTMWTESTESNANEWTSERDDVHKYSELFLLITNKMKWNEECNDLKCVQKTDLEPA